MTEPFKAKKTTHNKTEIVSATLSDLASPTGDLNDLRQKALARLPSLETMQRELGSARSLDDFFGKDGIMARLFGATLTDLMEAELSEHLGYERYSREGWNSGNSRNGKRERTLHSSFGDVEVKIPRDTNSTSPRRFSRPTRPAPTNWKRKSSTFTPKA